MTSTTGAASDMESCYSEEGSGRISPLVSDDADGKDRDREDGSIGSDSDQERQGKYLHGEESSGLSSVFSCFSPSYLVMLTYKLCLHDVFSLCLQATAQAVS